MNTKFKVTDVKKVNVIIGYEIIADCTLEGRNYEVGEDAIIIADEDTEAQQWPGTDFFDNHPYEFKPIIITKHI